MKKVVKLLCGAVFLLCICWFIGQQLKTARLNQEEQANSGWNLVDYIDTPAVVLNGRTESADYPYGYNLGAIEDDEVGRAVFLTAGTAIEIEGKVAEGTVLDVNYEIHPWVASESDGALLNIAIISGDVKQDYVYTVDGNVQRQTISMEQFSDCEVHIEMSVSNEEGKNENCDWVVLRQFSFASGGFEGKRPTLNGAGYVRSATYFADEWPLNFWNSEMDSLDADMEQIKGDGFDSIILVIPWREFQTGISPVEYNEYAFGRLDEVMTAAGNAGLGVYVRVGYESDFRDSIEQNEASRYLRLMGDPAVENAWYEYLERMYISLSVHNNFWGGFLTWEDFWNNLGVCDEPDEKARVEWADFVGYRRWVEEHFALEIYNENYGTQYASYSSIPVPQRTEPAMEAMYALYDDFLNNLLGKSQEKFPDLSMEVRMDWEVIYRVDGTADYYKHTITYPCMNSSYVATMYGIPIGFENVGERVGYQEAMEKTGYILRMLKEQNGGKPVYIDQFIFADNTPAFQNNAQIKEEEMNDYLENVAGVLRQYSEGYGIWTYRDYRANLLYNPQFVLEADGWDTVGKVSWEMVEDSAACTLEQGAMIQQVIPGGRNHFGTGAYTLEVDVVKVEEAGTLSVCMGEACESVEIAETGRISLVFEANSSLDVTLESVDCGISIDNVRLYNYIQRGYLYDEDNNELQCLEGVRSLNRQLQKVH